MKTNVVMPARAAIAGLVTIGLSGGLSAVAAQPAAAQSASAVTAVSVSTHVASAPAGAVTAAMGVRVVKIAATKKGTPYRYGSTGPRSFDCSGYTGWVMARIGKRIPRTANQQYRATIHINRSSARPGDLVFFGGSRKYHVGIYAGGNKMWHAPHTGSSVKLAKIYSSRVSFGRVR